MTNPLNDRVCALLTLWHQQIVLAVAIAVLLAAFLVPLHRAVPVSYCPQPSTKILCDRISHDRVQP
jgi:hypothetical protein